MVSKDKGGRKGEKQEHTRMEHKWQPVSNFPPVPALTTTRVALYDITPTSSNGDKGGVL